MIKIESVQQLEEHKPKKLKMAKNATPLVNS